MSKELNLYVEFSRNLNEDEQNNFWNEIVGLIESINLQAGGGHNSSYLDWVIDYQNSQLNKGEIIDKIGDFLNEKDDLILNFKIK